MRRFPHWRTEPAKKRRALSPIASMGANSLYYLLASNLTIFAISRIGVLPLYRKSAPFPFNLKAGSTGRALAWTLVMLIAALMLMAGGVLAELVEGQQPNWLVAKIGENYSKVGEVSQPEGFARLEGVTSNGTEPEIYFAPEDAESPIRFFLLYHRLWRARGAGGIGAQHVRRVLR